MTELKKFDVETTLAYIGVNHESVRQDAYNHWYRFIEFCKRNSGREWKHDIRSKLRSWIGIDFRYIDDYLKCCLSWGILELSDGVLIFKGIPDNVEIPTELTDKQLREELDEENEQRNKIGKPKVGLKELREMRSKRFKPVG